MEEVWRDVFGYEGLYQVSNFGRVRSVDRLVVHGNHLKLVKGRILKMRLAGRGYYVVQLSKNGNVLPFNVHRLVGKTFLANQNNLPQINHKDECKTNNFVWVNPDGSVDELKSNLEWCTHNYNLNYGSHNKNLSEHRKGKNTKPVLQLTTDGMLVKEWASITEAAKENDLYIQNICGVLHGRQVTCGGFIWKYKKEGD